MNAEQKAIEYANSLYEPQQSEWQAAKAAYRAGYIDGYIKGSNDCDEITKKHFDLIPKQQ